MKIKLPTRSDAGRAGAFALNSDPVKKSAAAIKAAQTRKAQNPNVFRLMGEEGARKRAQNKRGRS